MTTFYNQHHIVSKDRETDVSPLCKLTLELLGWSLGAVFSVPMDADCHDGVQASV